MRILVAVAMLAAALCAPAGADVLGEERLAVRLVTWGPEPVTLAEAQSAVEETDAFIRANSFGKAWLNADVAGWLHVLTRRPSRCDPAGINATVQQAVPGLAGYSRVAYLLPRIDCPWTGAYYPPGVWMLGEINPTLLAHELGHNWGVTEEGPAWTCSSGRCVAEDYGDPFSVMGHGHGHFDAYEKWTFGWIDRVGPKLRNGEVAISRIDRPSTRPHALYVLAGTEEYWIEYRPEPGGAVVHGGPSLIDPSTPSRFPKKNLLLAAGARRFAVAGAFEVRTVSVDGETARLSFRWTDRTRPTRPRLTTTVRRRAVRLRFGSTDRGSGVGAYHVSVDGQMRAVVPTFEELGRLVLGREPALALRLRPGRHRIAVVAVDRAGNRSRPRARTVRIR
jgi:hypothetical protein